METSDGWSIYNSLMVKQKRVYTRETLMGIKISRLAKIPSLLSRLAEIIELGKGLII